jgi:4-hydroxy-tetrahydrodipicolinate synthase
MMSGNDENCIAYSSHGGKGCISVISNIFPNECQQLQNYLKNGNYSEALKLQQELVPIYEAVFAESNPIGIKYAAQLLNLCSEEVKLPLTIARAATQESIKKILIEFRKI